MENWSASSRFGVNGWWGRQKLPHRPARFCLLRFQLNAIGSEAVHSDGRQPLHLIGRHAYVALARDEVPLAELAGLPLVLPARPHLLRARLDRLAAEHGLRLRVAIEANSVQLQYEVEAAGAGYAIC